MTVTDPENSTQFGDTGVITEQAPLMAFCSHIHLDDPAINCTSPFPELFPYASNYEKAHSIQT